MMSAKPKVVEFRLAGSLLEYCLAVFSALIKNSQHSSTIPRSHSESLRRLLERLILWNNDFNATGGDLDVLLACSDGLTLKPLILELLAAIGQTLSKRE